jgi:hypothetical protein
LQHGGFPHERKLRAHPMLVEWLGPEKSKSIDRRCSK